MSSSLNSTSIQSLTLQNTRDIKNLKENLINNDLNNQVNENTDDIKKLKEEFDDHKEENERDINLLKEEFDAHKKEFDAHKEENERDINLLKEEFDAHKEDNETDINSLQNTVSEHNNRITTLEGTVSDHDIRITKAEETIIEHSTIMDLMYYDKAENILNIRDDVNNKLKINSNFIGNFHGNVDAGNFVLGVPISKVSNAKSAFVVIAEKNNGFQNIMTGVQIGNPETKENVHGNIFDANKLIVDGDANIGGSLIVHNGITVIGDINHSGSLTVSNDLKVTGDVTHDGSLTVGNGLNVTGDVTHDGSLTVGNGFSVTNDSSIDGNLSINGHLDNTGMTIKGNNHDAHFVFSEELDNALYISNVKQEGDNKLSIYSNFVGNMTGNIYAGNLVLGVPTSKVSNAKSAFIVHAENNENLQNIMTGVQIGTPSIKENVHGNIFDANKLMVDGDANIGGSLIVHNGITVIGDINHSGSLTVSNDLKVTGDVTHDGSLTVGNGLNVTGDVTHDGSLTVGNGFSVTNDSSIDGNLTVTGQLIHSGMTLTDGINNAYLFYSDTEENTLHFSNEPEGENTLIISSNFDGNMTGNIYASNFVLGETIQSFEEAENVFIVNAVNDVVLGYKSIMTGVQIGNPEIKENVHGNTFDANKLIVTGNATIGGSLTVENGANITGDVDHTGTINSNEMLLTDGLTDSSDTGSSFNYLAVQNNLTVNGTDVMEQMQLIKNKLNELIQHHLEGGYGVLKYGYHDGKYGYKEFGYSHNYGYHGSYGYGQPNVPPSLLP